MDSIKNKGLSLLIDDECRNCNVTENFSCFLARFFFILNSHTQNFLVF